MKIKIYISISNKNKIQDFHKDMIKEYIKRLSKYAKTEIIYGNKKLKKISDNTSIFLINNSKTETSECLAKKVNDLTVSGTSEIIFIYNISQIENLNCSYNTFSVSTMNFTEETNVCVLLEQLYRSYKILNNENYHK